MRKILTALCLTVLAGAVSLHAQNVFTVVYADSYDGFVNVRSQPSNSGRILTRLEEAAFGLGDGVYCWEQQDGWLKVSVRGVTGWAYGKYVGKQTWYTGKGRKRLVAAISNTPLYREDFSGENEVGAVFARVPKGTILADEFDTYGNYFVLMTAHDNLLIRKSDVIVEKETPILF